MDEYGRVTERHDAIAVVCCGASLKSFDWALLRGKTVIAVNGAYRFCRPDYFFTLDPTGETAGYLGEAQHLCKAYCAYREIVPGYDRVTWLRTLRGDGWQTTYMGLSADPGAIANGNSGHGAYNMALLMGAKRVALLGLDGSGRHFFDDAERAFAHLPALFAASRVDGVEVLNGSPESTIECFPRVAPEEAVRWL